MKSYVQWIPFLALLVFISLQGCSPSGKHHEVQQADGSEAKDPLPSWVEGEIKKSIIDFVTRTTTTGHPEFIAAPDRIACFDNDGTLWAEQPYYFQLAFALDQIKAMAPIHPEWKTRPPFAAVLAGDVNGVLAGGEKAIFEILMATHAGMSADSFALRVKSWMASAKHPITDKPFQKMVYQPMLELLTYLRSAGYKTFIVSGGGIDFMRPWTEETYGIPPDQVVGSSGKVKYEVRDGQPVLIKMPEINFVDDKEGKPVGIHQHIGKRPVFTVGNSDGDYAMLQYTTAGTGPRMGMIIHHTDAEREYAYDRASHIGKLERGLDDAGTHGWKVVNMQKDWKVIYPE